MKVIVGNRDITQVISKIVWSGSESSVSRKLEVEVAFKKSDYYFNQLKIKVKEGDIILLKDKKDRLLFKGIIVDLSYSEASNVVSYSAFDFMFYLNNSDISLVKEDTAENITGEICSILGIKSGELAKTSVKQYQAYLPENAYKAIFKAYQFASSKTGKSYMVCMKDDVLEVVEKGLPSGVVLDENHNLIDASYKISLSKLVNKVLVIDKTGRVLDKIENSSSQKKYGTIQKITDKKDGAKELLNGLEKTISIHGLGDIRAITGRSLVFKDDISQKEYIFYIKSDSHIFTDYGSTMSLELSLNNKMEG